MTSPKSKKRTTGVKKQNRTGGRPKSPKPSRVLKSSLRLIRYSGKAQKRFTAIFADGRRVHFGQRNGRTYIDHGSRRKRHDYLKRHRKNENWNDPRSPGVLSRHLLWGSSTSLAENLTLYRKRFRSRL